MQKWVARLKCGHTAGGEHSELPTVIWCTTCNDGTVAVEVITTEPERHPETQRAW